MTRLVRALALAGVATLMGCSDTPSSASVPQRSMETLRLSALSVRIDESTLDVSAESWRSYQPTVGSRKDALLTLVRVRSTGAPIPPSLSLDGIYLIHEGEVYAAMGREEEPRPEGARFAEFMVREGPAWAPGDSVDVVVALKGGGATTVLLRAPRIAITRVD